MKVSTLALCTMDGFHKSRQDEVSARLTKLSNALNETEETTATSPTSGSSNFDITATSVAKTSPKSEITFDGNGTAGVEVTLDDASASDVSAPTDSLSPHAGFPSLKENDEPEGTHSKIELELPNPYNTITITYNGEERKILLARDEGGTASKGELSDLLKVTFSLSTREAIAGFSATVAASKDNTHSGVIYFPLSFIFCKSFEIHAFSEIQLLIKDDFVHKIRAIDSYATEEEGEDDSATKVHATLDPMKLSTFTGAVSLLVERGAIAPRRGSILVDYAEAMHCVDGEISGPLKTAFIIASWAKDQLLLAEALESLSDVLLLDDKGGTPLSMENIDFLLEMGDMAFLESLKDDKSFPALVSGPMSVTQYFSLHSAILHSHPAIVSAFEIYRSTLERAYDEAACIGESHAMVEDSITFLVQDLCRIAHAMAAIDLS